VEGNSNVKMLLVRNTGHKGSICMLMIVGDEAKVLLVNVAVYATLQHVDTMLISISRFSSPHHFHSLLYCPEFYVDNRDTRCYQLAFQGAP